MLLAPGAAWEMGEGGVPLMKLSRATLYLEFDDDTGQSPRLLVLAQDFSFLLAQGLIDPP